MKGDGLYPLFQIFGPVQVILKFESLDEAISRANNTRYGLASGILTKDIEKALYFSRRIQAGSVWLELSFTSV